MHVQTVCTRLYFFHPNVKEKYRVLGTRLVLIHCMPKVESIVTMIYCRVCVHIVLLLIIKLNLFHPLPNMKSPRHFCTTQEDYSNWSIHSPDCYLFGSLLSGAGPVLGQLLDDIIPLLAHCLNAQEPELRLQYVC